MQLYTALHSLRRSSNATILSCPNRIIYPTQDRAARLLAPAARCRDATQPLTLNATYNDLTQMVGSTKEVFYHASNGVFYVGLFLCTTTGELDGGAYAQLPKLVSSYEAHFNPSLTHYCI